MVNHLSFQDDTIEARRPATKPRQKKYTKTKHVKKDKPVSPKKTWWKKSSIYQVVCCQNTCYSFALYFTLAVFIALFVYAVWKICDLRLSSKSQHPNKQPQGNKDNNMNASNMTHRIDGVEGRLDPNTINSFKNIPIKKLQTTDRPRMHVTDAKQHQTTLRILTSPTQNAMTMNRNWYPDSLQFSPFNSPDDKRYMIPSIPPRFDNLLNDQFPGSGSDALEEWRAMRLALLRNRLKLTTGSSMPTESPYWKAWFQSRPNSADSYSNPFWKNPSGYDDRIRPIHDNTLESPFPMATNFPARQSQNVSRNSTKEIVKHSQIAALDPNSTFAKTYTKLLQDLVSKIHILQNAKVSNSTTSAAATTNKSSLSINPPTSLASDHAINLTSNAQVSIANPASVLGKNRANNISMTTTTETTHSPVTTKSIALTTSTTKVVAIRKHTTTNRLHDREEHTSSSHEVNKDGDRPLITKSGRHTMKHRKHRKRHHSRKIHHKHKHKKHRVLNKDKTISKKEEVRYKANHFDIDGSGSGGSGSGNKVGGESGSGMGSANGDADTENGNEVDMLQSASKHRHNGKKTPYIGLRRRLEQLHKKRIEKKAHHKRNRSKSEHKKTRKLYKHHEKGKYKGEKSAKKNHHKHSPKKHTHDKKKSKLKKRHKVRKKTNSHSTKHKFMSIVQRKLKRIRKKNQIAQHLGKLHKKLAELMKKNKKHEKKTSNRPKMFIIPRKKQKLPKKWHASKAQVENCAVIKKYAKNHFVGIQFHKKKHNKNIYIVTECSLKHGSHHRYTCRKSFFRTRGLMILKSVKRHGKNKLYLVICRSKSTLRRALAENVNKIKKAEMTVDEDGGEDYENSKRSNLPDHKNSHVTGSRRHHKKLHLRNHHHKHKARHVTRSKHKRKHESRQRRQRRKHRHNRYNRIYKHKKHHKRSRKHKKQKEDDDEEGDTYGSGSGKDEDESSGDVEERFERSASSSKSLHTRTKHVKKYGKLHGRGSKKAHRNETKNDLHHNITINHNDGRSKMYEEFFDMMKEMKDVMRQNTGINLMKEANASKVNASSSFNASSVHGNFSAANANRTNVSYGTVHPTFRSTMKTHGTTNTTSSTNNANLLNIQDMVAKIIPAVVQQIEKKSMPSMVSVLTTKSQIHTNESSISSASTRSSTSTNTKTSTTEKHPTSHPKTVRNKVPTTPSAHRLHTSARHTSPHITPSRHRTPHRTTHAPTHHPTTIKHPLKTTPAPNIAMILKGLKALGLGPIVQHATTKSPKMQKKSNIPSKPQTPIQKKQNAPTVGNGIQKNQLPVPIPKPLPLHNPYQIHLLCFGDSLTAGYHNHGKAFSPYGNRLRQLINLSSRIPATVEIKGIVGEMTHKQMVSRLPEVLGNSSMFDWVVILGGTNDILHVKNFADDQEFLNQLESVWQPRITKDIEKLHTISQNYGAHTMLLTIPENAIELWPGYKILLKMRTKINNALRQFAAQHRDKIALCDIAQKLPRHTLSEQQEALIWDDHLHMTEYGYNKMAEEVHKCLKPYLPK